MSFWEIIEKIFIGPLKLVFEIIFYCANSVLGHPGVAIIFLSLAMNILVLPLYRRADAMQEASRDIEAKLKKGVDHIKKAFSGDERMMILQTYYRQNDYKPTDVLNGSVSLLLEIPFFMAAYQFLSGMDILKGVSFGPISDLGSPDGMLVIGPLTLNLLPILMTLINVISSYIYLKGFPLKTKIQLYAMALFFLFFLYESPSALVFYWTLNNLFSLVKNVFYKIKNPQKVLRILCAVLGVSLVLVSLAFGDAPKTRRSFLFALGLLLELPILIYALKSSVKLKFPKREPKPSFRSFLLGSVFLTAFIGAFIPSVYIAASPMEYVDIFYYHNPIWYIVSSLCMAAGIFIVWMGVFYWLATPRFKEIFCVVTWAFSVIAVTNYMLFGTNLGVISSTLQYEGGVAFAFVDVVVNILLAVILSVIVFICFKYSKRVISTVLAVALIAISGMSLYNSVKIGKNVSLVNLKQNSPVFELSKDGKNVVVIMLDRAMGEYVPYIFNEKPELKDKFAGFTYYGNTVSFGGFTNFGSPALLGGYEYTPVEMNKRDSESLVSKHNEAHKVMPALFAQNGFDVTVCDPVYTNYRWIPDLTVFNDLDGVDAYITKGRFGDEEVKESVVRNNHRNFFCFSLMKASPLFLQPNIYNGGRYNSVESSVSAQKTLQTRNGMSRSEGIFSTFMESYNVLANMSQMTDITESKKNTFMFLSNDITHEPMLLSEPDYTPAMNVNNEEYDSYYAYRFNLNGRLLKVANADQMIHYHANMAAFLQLANWFDYLRENGVYDNTRIILVSDHGRYLHHLKELDIGGYTDRLKDLELYFPLLMVKDFGATEYTESYEFMTNADVPTLAVKDIIDDPKNPYTGKKINNSEKTAHDQYIIVSESWDVKHNNGNTFADSRWASVRDSIWDKNNWKFYDGNAVLKDHAFPG